MKRITHLFSRLWKSIVCPLLQISALYIIYPLLRIRTRFYVAATIILTSVAVTPWAVGEAYNFRGYHAIGGEALIIPMGILAAYMVCYTMNERDMAVERRENPYE